jgi:hypothetical protein
MDNLPLVNAEQTGYHPPKPGDGRIVTETVFRKTQKGGASLRMRTFFSRAIAFGVTAAPPRSEPVTADR